MKTLRWIISFPTTMILSGVAWMFIQSLFHTTYCGGGIFRSIVGLAPLIIEAALPTILFVVVGVLLSPSRERKVAFIFFALSPLFSGGGMGLVEAYQNGVLPFWLVSAAGVVLGALLGLFVSLGIQNLRKRRANQALLPTPMSGAADL
jgi:hypothetical protein